MKKLIRAISMLLICSLLLNSQSCIFQRKSSEERYMRKQRKIMDRQARKEYKYQLKKHRDMQSDQTLDLMDRNKRHSRKVNKVRRNSFWDWFKSCDDDKKK